MRAGGVPVALAPTERGPGYRTRRQTLAGWGHRTGLLSLAGRVRGLLHQDLRILAYHRVLDSVHPPGFEFDLELISASAESFRRQIAVLRRDFVPMRFDEVIDCIDRRRRLPPRAVLVSFDDGYDDNYRVAFPILRELDVPAMFFVATGHIESGLPYAYDWLVYMICTTPATELSVPAMGVDWILPATPAERRGHASRFLELLKREDALAQQDIMQSLEQEWGMPRIPHPDCRPMTWAQLREMRDGGMELGSHGVHHHMLAKLPHAQMVAEIRGSKMALESNLGQDVCAMSYPVGGFEAFDDAVMEAAGAAGFRLACSYVSGTNRLRRQPLHSLRRLHVERDVDAAWFHGMLELPELFTYRTNMLIG
ncbi:MAG: polysaccharide deacetylase [Lysobacteraceae bacterium]|nr:MAG: polysaccharide deacetylase [Xanthomonadaceae bacterium]